MCCQQGMEDQHVTSLTNEPKHTSTLAEQYSRFIPAQVTHSSYLYSTILTRPINSDHIPWKHDELLLVHNSSELQICDKGSVRCHLYALRRRYIIILKTKLELKITQRFKDGILFIIAINSTQLKFIESFITCHNFMIHYTVSEKYV